MTLKDATTICFQKYATFSGRAGRQEFWKFILFLLIVNVILVVINSLIFGPTVTEGVRYTISSNGAQSTQAFRNVTYTGGWFATIFSLVTFLPLLAVTWRRLHDRNRAGWWALVPYALLAAMIAVWFLTGEPVSFGTNTVTGDPVTAIMPSSIAPLLILGLCAFAAFVSVFISMCRASVPGANRFGPNPNEVSS